MAFARTGMAAGTACNMAPNLVHNVFGNIFGYLAPAWSVGTVIILINERPCVPDVASRDRTSNQRRHASDLRICSTLSMSAVRLPVSNSSRAMMSMVTGASAGRMPGRSITRPSGTNGRGNGR